MTAVRAAVLSPRAASSQVREGRETTPAQQDRNAIGQAWHYFAGVVVVVVVVVDIELGGPLFCSVG